MEKLYNLGITYENIKDMIDMNPSIIELTNSELENKIQVLKSINCTDKQIKNIIVSNPKYLCRSDDDILNLIKKLLKLKMTNINLLLDSNPYLLNKDAYEIDEFIKQNNISDIVNELEINPFIMDES